MSFKDAEKYKNWLSNMCSILIKLYHGFSINNKVKTIWRQKPEHWPHDELFYDPHNTKCRGKKENQRLLTMLLKCVEIKGVQIGVNINEEIEAWKSHDKKRLLKLFTLRQHVKQIDSELFMLFHYSTSDTRKFYTKHFELVFTLQHQKDPKAKKVIHRSEAMRRVACLLCKIYHGVQVEIKSDSIWKTCPKNWPDDICFTNPYHKRNKCDKWEDERLAKTLLNCCFNEAIVIPAPYRNITTALSENDYENLITNVVVCSSEAKLQKILIQLDNDNILEETCAILRQQCSEIVHSLKVEQNRLTQKELLTWKTIENRHQSSNHKRKVTDVNIERPKTDLNENGKRLKFSCINKYNESLFVAKEDQIDALSSASVIHSTSAENYLDLRAEKSLSINCYGKTGEETTNFTSYHPLHHIREKQVKFKIDCLTDDKESAFGDLEDHIDISSTPGIVPATAKHCFYNPVDKDSYIYCNGYHETETSIAMSNLLDSVDLSNQFDIDKNFPKSLCNHLLSCNT